jgi:hypothetical protein
MNRNTDPFSPRGKIIGTYKGIPIHETLTLTNQVYGYDGIAVECRGRNPLHQLKAGQLMVAPGLIYSPIQ